MTQSLEESFLPPCAWCVPSDVGKFTYEAAPMCQMHRACFILASGRRCKDIYWLVYGNFPRGKQVLSGEEIVSQLHRQGFDVNYVLISPLPHHL